MKAKSNVLRLWFKIEFIWNNLKEEISVRNWDELKSLGEWIREPLRESAIHVTDGRLKSPITMRLSFLFRRLWTYLKAKEWST